MSREFDKWRRGLEGIIQEHADGGLYKAVPVLGGLCARRGGHGP